MTSSILPNDPYYSSTTGPERSVKERSRPSTLDNQGMARKINSDLRRMRNHTGRWRRDAKEDYNFYSGDQWSDDDLGQLKESLRPVITYNRIQPIVDAVSGTEVNNRQEVQYYPREQGDIGVNEVLTGAAQWVRDECDAEDEESDSFVDLLISGMGWTETRIVYDEDPDGRIVIVRVDPLEMYWDTAARKRNLGDAKHVARVMDYDDEEFAATWPEWADKISPMSGQWDEGWTDDEGEAHFNDEIGYVGEEADAGYDQEKRIYKVIEYQWYELEPYYRTVNPSTGKIESVSMEAGAKLRPYMEQENIPMVKQFRRKYYRAFAVGYQLLERHELPVQTGFTYQAMTGKRDRNRRVWHGMVKQMKDPQKWANKFFSQILHVLNTNAKGGILAEQDAFLDPDEAEQAWAAPDSILYVQSGAISGPNPKIMPKPLGQYPQGTDKLMQFSLESFREVTGVNTEFVGQADANNRSGVVEIERKQSAITVLAPVFDALRRYRKSQGRVLLEYIREYISDGRLVRILGKDGTEQYVPLTRDETTIRYDVIVDDAPTSTNQKQRVFAVLSVLLQPLLAAGIPIPPEILDYTPLPHALVSKWKESLKPKEGEKKPSPDEIKAQGSAMKDQSIAQLNAAKAQVEQAQVGVLQAQTETERAKAQGLLAQAQAQVARLAELTPVDAAQAQHFVAKTGLEEQRTATEKIRGQTMLQDSLANENLIREKVDTEEARQVALRSKPNGQASNKR